MAISAKDVQKLREMTGVGMMDCKKALTASDGDIEKAVEWLREKGMAASAKKAGRIAAEGMSLSLIHISGSPVWSATAKSCRSSTTSAGRQRCSGWMP